ncbi:MAG: DUF420 domain-containing protein [Tepidisphaeraceae bacterium]
MTYGFPELNATLNAASAILLLVGYCLIKSGRWRAHGWTMASATLVSAVFLACYLTYHILHGERSTKLSHAPHWLRTIYLFVLLPHLFLAVAMLPMIYLTLLRAYRRDWPNHRRIAPPTFWIWMYVSVSGVVVYLLLYHTALYS